MSGSVGTYFILSKISVGLFMSLAEIIRSKSQNCYQRAKVPIN